MGFNVDLVLLGILLFFTKILVLCDCINWIFVKLFICFVREKVLHFFLIAR